MEKKADLMASDLEGDNVLMMAISQNHLDIAAGLRLSRLSEQMESDPESNTPQKRRSPSPSTSAVI